MVPPDVPKNLLAGPLPLELTAALEKHNAACEQQARIRLRAVLHAGEVRLDDYGVAGGAINLAFRLLESAALRSVLAGSPDVLALMASEWFFQEVIRHDPMSSPAAFRRVHFGADSCFRVLATHLPCSLRPGRYAVNASFTAAASFSVKLKLVPVGEKQFLFLVSRTPHFALNVMRTLARRLRSQNVAV